MKLIGGETKKKIMRMKKIRRMRNEYIGDGC